MTQQATLLLAKGNNVHLVWLSYSSVFPDSTVGSVPVRLTLTWKSKINMLRMVQINSQAKTQKIQSRRKDLFPSTQLDAK